MLVTEPSVSLGTHREESTGHLLIVEIPNLRRTEGKSGEIREEAGKELPLILTLSSTSPLRDTGLCKERIRLSFLGKSKQWFLHNPGTTSDPYPIDHPLMSIKTQVLDQYTLNDRNTKTNKEGLIK